MIYTLTLNPALDRELTIPAFHFDQVLRASQVRQDLGGKGLNVSRALKALGVDSTACGFIGGATGELLLAGLNDLGIPNDFTRVGGETRTNTSIVTEGHDRYLKVNMPGSAISKTGLATLLKTIRNLTKPGDWWVLAGSLPPGIPNNIYAEIIQEVESRNARVILDAEGDPLRSGCRAHPFLVKPNAMEAGQLVGGDIASLQEAARAARQIRDLGAQNVIISLGKQGAVFLFGQETRLATAPSIREANPIGAGDALLAGILYGFCRNFSPDDVIRWGVACGTAAARLPATVMGSLKDVKDLVKRVQVEVFHEGERNELL